jgi:hypothetical protein
MEAAIFKSKKEALELICIINSYSELSLIYEEFWGVRETALCHAGYFLCFLLTCLLHKSLFCLQINAYHGMM